MLKTIHCHSVILLHALVKIQRADEAESRVSRKFI